VPLTLPIHDHTLANGLRLVISPDHVAPLVAVDVWYNVGSRHEQPGRTGFAHLFEHIMFQGSAHVAKGEHFELIQKAGGSLNGTTSFDRTNYYETVPSNQLELALWLEADRMGGLLAALDQENLDNQRDVVKNEKRQSYDNQPYGTRHQHIVEMLFPRGHQYDHLPIGSMEDLDAASLEDVQGFFRAHYAPNNAVLAIAGDVEPDDALHLAERYFGGIPANRDLPPAPHHALPPLGSEVRMDVREERVPAERFIAAYRFPAEGTDAIEVLDVASAVLSAGQGSRLRRRLVRRDQLAQGASFGVERMVGGVSMGLLDVTARSGVTLEQIEEVIAEELTALATDPPTPAEMERAQALTERGWLDQLSMLVSRADSLCRATLQRGTPDEVNTALDRALAVTAEEVSAAAGTYLRDDNRVVLTYHLDPTGNGDDGSRA
jgi:predicted Zn-dependent peptidase